MKTYTLFLSFILGTFLVSCSASRNDCAVLDITGSMTEEEIKVLKAGGYDWMRNAMVCRMGEFEIATPAETDDNKANIIFVYRKGKPVFYRKNTGTEIYSPKLTDASAERVMVNIWHGGDYDEVERIWYQTIGKNPEVMIDDIDFDGQPDVKTIWEKNEILEVYLWKDGKWQNKE